MESSWNAALSGLWDSLRAALGLKPAQVTAASRQGGGPARILLMRHAEKTGDPDDMYLSEAGVRRTERLATYIPETFGRPDFIFAASKSKHSFRSIETMKPLAAALGLKVHHHVEDNDFADLVTMIFSDAQYQGATIVICWHHQKLPEIAQLLGAKPGLCPDPWPLDLFNLILKFDYDAASNALPNVTRIEEPF